MLLIEGIDRYIVIDTRHYPGRGIEEPPKDKVLRGSRDGFAEALAPNSALIRRRIRDNRLIFEKLTLGESTKTDLLVCYMDGMADKAYVDNLKRQISAVRTPSVQMLSYKIRIVLFTGRPYSRTVSLSVFSDSFQ